MNSDGTENITDIKRVIHILKCMNELLEEEYLSIKNDQIKKLTELQEKKVPLMKWLDIFNYYVSRDNPNFFKNLAENERNEFVELYTIFQETVTKNEREISKAIKFNKKMAEFIHGEQNEIGLSIYDYNGIKRTAIYNENKINEPVILKNLEA